MELSYRVVMILPAQVQRQTKTASKMLYSCLKFKSLPSLKVFNKPITTIRLIGDSGRFGKRRFDKRRFGKRRFGKRRFGKRRFGKRRFGKRRFGKRRFGKRRFGKIRFGRNMAADVTFSRRFSRKHSKMFHLQNRFREG